MKHGKENRMIPRKAKVGEARPGNLLMGGLFTTSEVFVAGENTLSMFFMVYGTNGVEMLTLKRSYPLPSG
jgi:hypothetical protein